MAGTWAGMKADGSWRVLFQCSDDESNIVSSASRDLNGALGLDIDGTPFIERE